MSSILPSQIRLPGLLEEFKVTKHKIDGSYSKLLKMINKVELLIFDEWL